jgi:hypothetical protein
MAEEKIVISLETKIIGLEEQLKATTNIREYNKLLRDAKSLLLEAGDSGTESFNRVQNIIGQSNDRVSDLNENIRLLSGNPVENVTNSFTGMGTAIRNLDFGSASNSARAFNTSLQNFKIKDLINEFKAFLVTLGSLGKVQTANTVATKAAATASTQDAAARTADAVATRGLTVATQGATVATNTFSAALKGTGILLLIGAVVALIANFDKLKESGGFIGALFTGISKTIGSLIQGFKDLTDFLGLTNFKQKEQEEQDKKINEVLKERSKILDESTKKQLEALGASTKWYDLIISQKELNDLQGQYNDLKNKSLKDIDDEIKSKNEELATLTDEIVKKSTGAEIRRSNLITRLEELSLEKERALQSTDILSLETKILEKNLQIKEIKTSIANDEAGRNEKNSIELNKIYAQTIKNAYDATDKKLSLDKQEEALKLSIYRSQLRQQKEILQNELDGYDIIKDRLGLLYELPAQYDVIKGKIKDIDVEDKKAQDESTARQKVLNTQRTENRLKSIQATAQAEIDNYKRVFDQIDRDQSMSVENRKITEKALLNDQIAFIEKNIDKLFPKDPNKSNAAAAEEQVGKARAAVAGLQKQVEDIDTDSIKRQKEAADSRLTSEAKIMSLRAKSIQEVHAAEIANLESKFASETKIVDFRNMTAEEVAAYEKSEEARRLQFETELGALKLKQQEELTQKKLGDMEREAEFLSSKAKTGGAFNIGQQLEALDAEHALKLEQMNVQMEKELKVVGTTEEEKLRIKEFYAQKEEELGQKTQESKLESIREAIEKGAALAEQGMRLASAIEEIVRNNNRKNLKEGEVISEKAQKREFNSQKALGIVSVGIDTAKGIGAALKLLPTNPIYGKIMMALIGATGLAQIGAIQSQKFTPETGSSSSAGAGATPNLPSLEQTNISTPTLFGLGQFNPANAPSNQQQRVYVLESDITRSQQNVRQVQVSAGF